MAVNNDVKMLSLLMLALLAMVIIVGTIYVVADNYKATLCTTADSTHVYSDGSCLESSSNSTAVTVESITKVNIVLTAISIVLGFLAVIVIVAVAKIIVKMTQGMAGGE